MPALRNAKHEAFCQNVAKKGMIPAEAYLAAGYIAAKPLYAQQGALKIGRRSDIRERIDELGGKKKDGRIAVEQVALSHRLGRPTLYRPELAEMARKLALLGLNDVEMADALNISPEVLDNWKAEHPEFVRAIARGGVHADAKMADRLYFRGLGYKHKAVKIFHHPDTGAVQVPYVEHYPPDTNAASLWLRNRQPDKWRAAERHDVNVTGSIEHRLSQMTMEERVRSARELGERARARLAELGIIIEHQPRRRREGEE